MKEPRNEREAAMVFGGCDCSLGLAQCNCIAACEKPEPLFDRDPIASKAIAAAILVAVLVVLALLAGVIK